MMSQDDQFRYKAELIKAFCDSAKSYVQIASAGLALPLVFASAILGQSLMTAEIPWSLRLYWLCLLFCILFGLIYQWLAVRRLWDQFHDAHRTIANSRDPGFRKTWWIPKVDKINLSLFYLGMTGSLLLGAFFFVLFAFQQLSHGNEPIRHLAEPMF